MYFKIIWNIMLLQNIKASTIYQWFYEYIGMNFTNELKFFNDYTSYYKSKVLSVLYHDLF